MNTFLKTCGCLVISIGTLIALSDVASAQEAKHSDVLIADFEAETYGDWKVEGEAFGSGPAEGTLAGQMHVFGFHGKRPVNSFFLGDRTTGTFTSPEFTIQRPWIKFLIGGGGHEGKTPPTRLCRVSLWRCLRATKRSGSPPIRLSTLA
jgi:fructan beta-fructosidase